MSTIVSLFPHSSLRALRGATSAVVGAGDTACCWDRMVALWRIFLALDGLMALLWSIVDQIAAGEIKLDGARRDKADVMRGERPVSAGPARVRPAARRPAPVAGVGVTPISHGSAGWECRDRGFVRPFPVLAVGLRQFSDLGLDAVRNCVQIVTIIQRIHPIA